MSKKNLFIYFWNSEIEVIIFVTQISETVVRLFATINQEKFFPEISCDMGSFPFLPPPPADYFPPVEAVAAATSVHVFIH